MSYYLGQCFKGKLFNGDVTVKRVAGFHIKIEDEVLLLVNAHPINIKYYATACKHLNKQSATQVNQVWGVGILQFLSN